MADTKKIEIGINKKAFPNVEDAVEFAKGLTEMAVRQLYAEEKE